MINLILILKSEKIYKLLDIYMNPVIIIVIGISFLSCIWNGKYKNSILCLLLGSIFLFLVNDHKSFIELGKIIFEKTLSVLKEIEGV